MMRYVLSKNIKIRREYFGAITLDIIRQQTRYFNSSASAILFSCLESRNYSELLAIFDELSPALRQNITDFLSQQVEVGLLTKTPQKELSDAASFNLNANDLCENHLHVPLGVELELTLKCLRSCKYCAYDAHPKVKTSSELTTSEWIAVLEDLCAAGVFFVRFTGGDPLTRSDFADILMAADRLGFVITVGSDLTDLSESNLQALSSAQNLYALQTTLDGATPETADILRGAGNFEMVVNGIRRLKNVGVPVILGSVLNRENVSELSEIATLAGELGVDGYCVGPLYAAGRGNSKTLEHLLPTNEDLSKAARLFKAATDEKVIQAADPAWLIGTDGLSNSDLDEVWKEQGYLFHRPDTLMRIDSTGRVYTSIKLKPVLNDAAYVGNVRTSDFRELWRYSPLLKNLRKIGVNQKYFGHVVDVREMELEKNG